MRRRSSRRSSTRREAKELLGLAVAAVSFTGLFIIAVYWLAFWSAYVDVVFP